MKVHGHGGSFSFGDGPPVKVTGWSATIVEGPASAAPTPLPDLASFTGTTSGTWCLDDELDWIRLSPAYTFRPRRLVGWLSPGRN